MRHPTANYQTANSIDTPTCPQSNLHPIVPLPVTPAPFSGSKPKCLVTRKVIMHKKKYPTTYQPDTPWLQSTSKFVSKSCCPPLHSSSWYAGLHGGHAPTSLLPRRRGPHTAITPPNVHANIRSEPSIVWVHVLHIR